VGSIFHEYLKAYLFDKYKEKRRYSGQIYEKSTYLRQINRVWEVFGMNV